MPAYRLPLAPSANRLVQPFILPGRGKRGKPMVRLVPTTEAKDFREAAHARLPVAPIAGPVELYLTVSVPSISSDAQNREKAVCDALNGRLYFDDSQIAELHLVKVIGEPGCVVEVVPADPVEHAELARRLAKSSIQERANERAQPALFNVTPNFKANR